MIYGSNLKSVHIIMNNLPLQQLVSELTFTYLYDFPTYFIFIVKTVKRIFPIV